MRIQQLNLQQDLGLPLPILAGAQPELQHQLNRPHGLPLRVRLLELCLILPDQHLRLRMRTAQLLQHSCPWKICQLHLLPCRDKLRIIRCVQIRNITL